MVHESIDDGVDHVVEEVHVEHHDGRLDDVERDQPRRQEREDEDEVDDKQHQRRLDVGHAHALDARARERRARGPVRGHLRLVAASPRREIVGADLGVLAVDVGQLQGRGDLGGFPVGHPGGVPEEAAVGAADLELLAPLGDDGVVDEAVEDEHGHAAHEEEAGVDPLQGVEEVLVDGVLPPVTLPLGEDRLQDHPPLAPAPAPRLADVACCHGDQGGVARPRL